MLAHGGERLHVLPGVRELHMRRLRHGEVLQRNEERCDPDRVGRVTLPLSRLKPYSLVITERPLPIGGANYSAIAPRNSFIELSHDDHGRYDLATFAKLIKALAGNKRKLVEYFWWKEYYEVRIN